MHTRLICTLLILLLATVITAQNASDDLVLLVEDTIQIYDLDTNMMTLVTELPEDYRAVYLSPNNQQVLYVTEIEEIEAIEDYRFGPRARDFFLLDLATGESTLIVGQPDEISSAVDLRVFGFPTWSPDGTQIAWVEGTEAGTLSVYTVATGETQMIYDGIPGQTLTPNPIGIKAWTGNGILIDERDLEGQATNLKIATFHFYQLDGTVISVPNPFEQIISYEMMQMPDGERISVNTGAEWYFLDPTNPSAEPQSITSGRTGTTTKQVDDAPVVLRSILQEDGERTADVILSDGTLVTTLNQNRLVRSLNPLVLANGKLIQVGRDENQAIILYDVTDDQLLTVEIKGRSRTLAPGGTQVVYVTDDTVYIPRTHCVNTTLGVRLLTRQNAYVLPGNGPNNLRAEPTISSELLTEIPENDWVRVTDGPVCADGFTWWEVEYNEFVGWTAEAGADVYWLAPGCPDRGCVRG